MKKCPIHSYHIGSDRHRKSLELIHTRSDGHSVRYESVQSSPVRSDPKQRSNPRSVEFRSGSVSTVEFMQTAYKNIGRLYRTDVFPQGRDRAEISYRVDRNGTDQIGPDRTGPSSTKSRISSPRTGPSVTDINSDTYGAGPGRQRLANIFEQNLTKPGRRRRPVPFPVRYFYGDPVSTF